MKEGPARRVGRTIVCTSSAGEVVDENREMSQEEMPWQGSNLLIGLERLEAHFERVEPRILSLVPEEGRFERPRRRARVLLG